MNIVKFEVDCTCNTTVPGHHNIVSITKKYFGRVLHEKYNVDKRFRSFVSFTWETGTPAKITEKVIGHMKTVLIEQLMPRLWMTGGADYAKVSLKFTRVDRVDAGTIEPTETYEEWKEFWEEKVEKVAIQLFSDAEELTLWVESISSELLREILIETGVSHPPVGPLRELIDNVRGQI